MNEKVNEVIHDPKFAILSASVSAFLVGLGVGYIFGRNHRREIHIIPEKQPFDHEAMEEFLQCEEAKRGIVREEVTVVEEIVETPVVDHSAEQIAGADFVAKRLQEDIESHQGGEPEPVRQSVFAENTDDWDYDEELRHRSPAAPYILHKDEFYGEEKEEEGYTQTTLTYYAGDDIMVNQDESPLYNYGSVVGPLKFGHGSGDRKVFYVRNNRRKAEYEIIHDTGLYSVEVLGLEIEDNQRVKALEKTDLKFRQSD